MNNSKEFIYEDLTHVLIRCFFNVHNSLGVGYDEKAYHRALARHFQNNEIEHHSKERKALFHRNRKVKEYEADFVVFKKIILELKTLQSNFLQINYVQIISELKLWNLRLGLLVNFGLQKVEIKRIPLTEKRKVIIENYEYIKDAMTDSDRKLLAQLREAIFNIFEVHGLGYGESIYQKILGLELDFRRIKYKSRFPIRINFEDKIISVFKMKPLLLENRIICNIKALTKEIDFYDIAKIQSYLRSLGLRIGIIVNFGKNQLELRGIRA